MIPFIDLKPYVDLVGGYDKLHDQTSPKYEFNGEEILDTHDFINGPHTTALEAELNRQLGTKHVIACASGTSALTLALAAHGIDHTFMVAMPNVTFWATYEAVSRAGAAPLLIDIDPMDLQMSFEQFTRAHDRFRFKAAVLPHLFGWCSAQLRNFRTFCTNRGIILIEDGAQAFGVEYEGSSVFAGADTITLSFYPAKVIGGIMDGGAVLTYSGRTAATVRMLANHGRTGHYEHKLVGFNSRMSEINAAWLVRALAQSNKILENRRTLLKRYHERRVGRLPPSNVTSNGYLLVDMCGMPTTDLPDKLVQRGVGSARIYPVPISRQPAAARTAAYGSLEDSDVFCQHVINLPLYYGMDPKDVETAARALQAVLK